MRKTFVIRGQTASDAQEVLNFGKYKAGYAYKLVEFKLFPSQIATTLAELSGTITAGKTAEDPTNPNFNNDGLIGTAIATMGHDPSTRSATTNYSVINDTFIITQNLILKVIDNYAGSPMAVNWQCRFESVKMTGSEEAAVNYKQFSISDE
jgi:hypothetical protein